ncbi:unnamed protein product [Calypogeia fissa]
MTTDERKEREVIKVDEWEAKRGVEPQARMWWGHAGEHSFCSVVELLGRVWEGGGRGELWAGGRRHESPGSDGNWVGGLSSSKPSRAEPRSTIPGYDDGVACSRSHSLCVALSLSLWLAGRNARRSIA